MMAERDKYGSNGYASNRSELQGYPARWSTDAQMVDAARSVIHTEKNIYGLDFDIDEVCKRNLAKLEEVRLRGPPRIAKPEGYAQQYLDYFGNMIASTYANATYPGSRNRSSTGRNEALTSNPHASNTHLEGKYEQRVGGQRKEAENLYQGYHNYNQGKRDDQCDSNLINERLEMLENRERQMTSGHTTSSEAATSYRNGSLEAACSVDGPEWKHLHDDTAVLVPTTHHVEDSVTSASDQYKIARSQRCESDYPKINTSNDVRQKFEHRAKEIPVNISSKASTSNGTQHIASTSSGAVKPDSSVCADKRKEYFEKRKPSDSPLSQKSGARNEVDNSRFEKSEVQNIRHSEDGVLRQNRDDTPCVICKANIPYLDGFAFDHAPHFFCQRCLAHNIRTIISTSVCPLTHCQEQLLEFEVDALRAFIRPEIAGNSRDVNGNEISCSLFERNAERTECAFCFNTLESGNGIQFSHGDHYFCRNCIQGYVRTDLGSRRCPLYKKDYCKQKLAEYEVDALRELFPNDAMLTRYKKEKYPDDNEWTKACKKNSHRKKKEDGFFKTAKKGLSRSFSFLM